MVKMADGGAKTAKKYKKVPDVPFKKKMLADDSDNSDNEESITKWYDEFSFDPKEFPEPTEEQISNLKKEAQKLLDSEIAAYEVKASRRSNHSDRTWLKTMMSSGTTSDKMAAFTILIQESPIHNLNTLQTFINMVKIGKKECLEVIVTLTELFLSDLLPPDRKLRVFAACPITLVDKLSSGNQISRNKRLVRWHFEDELKQLYHEFLVHLNTAAKDSIEANKEKAIVALYKLLSGNPEKESFILTTLVNKLGDPSQKVGSKTIYCLSQLLLTHPAMKEVITEEIEKLIFRPNVSPKAQYFGVCFLTQIRLSSYNGELAKNLIKIYFSFFKSCVKKGDVDTKMMKVLLIGVNRAFPFVSKENGDQISEHIDMLYKIVHVANYNVSLHALCLIFQVADYDQSISDRFYTALYRKLADPCLATSTHHATFFNLLYRALQKNDNISRRRVFLKRLLQVSIHLPTPQTCGMLFMASQLIGNNQDLLPLQIEESKYGDDDEDDGNGEESYKDALLDNDADDTLESKDDVKVEVKPQPSSTWFHIHSTAGDTKPHRRKAKYDCYERNPLHAGGEHCVFTELTKLEYSYHPTISLFAKTILSGKTVQYSGDPLQDFVLIRFLDRFVFKNPKKATVLEHVKPSPFARKKNYVAKGLKSLAVNSNSYLNESEDRIPIEEVYMYKYLQKKREEGKTVNQEKEDRDGDTDSVGSDDFEEMMDGLMGGKNKDLDFADDVGDKLTSKHKNNKKNSKQKEDDDSDENEYSQDEDDEEDDEDDEDEDDGDDGEGMSDDDDDDAEVLEFGDDDDDNEFQLGDDFNVNDISDMSDEEIMLPTKKNQKKKLLSKFKGPNKSIFASADKFAEMLEESGASSLKTSGSSALANKDKAAEKQMNWEVSRNSWMTDDKWKGKQRKRKMGDNSSGKFNKNSKKNKRF